jgi:hypothetical protein
MMGMGLLWLALGAGVGLAADHRAIIGAEESCDRGAPNVPIT